MYHENMTKQTQNNKMDTEMVAIKLFETLLMLKGFRPATEEEILEMRQYIGEGRADLLDELCLLNDELFVAGYNEYSDTYSSRRYLMLLAIFVAIVIMEYAIPLYRFSEFCHRPQ